MRCRCHPDLHFRHPELRAFGHETNFAGRRQLKTTSEAIAAGQRLYTEIDRRNFSGPLPVSSDAQRFMFGFLQLADGIDFTIIAMGVFGISEVILALEKPEARSLVTATLNRIFPSRDDLRESWPAMLRGTGIGSILGILPGGGAIFASFASYALEKRVAKDPGKFGHGAIAGVAGPESANNAGAQMSFIPLLTLGIT